MPAGWCRRAYHLANPQIFRGCFPPVLGLFVAHLGTLIEGAEARSLDGRDVHKHVFATAIWLNKSVTLCRIKPLHRSCRHVRTPCYNRATAV
jgi:hypothetical protein